MAFDPKKLRGWLRQAPQPSEIRIKDADDESRLIALDDNVRNRWKHAEAAVLGAQARVVECLDAKGKILRTVFLEDDDTAEEVGALARATDSANRSREVKEMALMLDRYGDRMNEAFDRGAAAAGTSQDHLVSLVEVLTGHLSMAITNLHNVSVNLANFVAGKEPGDDTSQPQSQLALQNILGLLAAQVARGAVDPAAGTPPQQNGAKKP